MTDYTATIVRPSKHSGNWSTHRVARIEFPREDLGDIVTKLQSLGFKVDIREPNF